MGDLSAGIAPGVAFPFTEIDAPMSPSDVTNGLLLSHVGASSIGMSNEDYESMSFIVVQAERKLPFQIAGLFFAKKRDASCPADRYIL